jgi:hypothetical protein
MNRSLFLAGLVFAVAACGTGSQTPAAHASPNVAAIYHQVAQCIRDHGAPNFPDPTVDASGHPQLPPGTQQPPQAALTPCRSILNQLPASDRPAGTVPQDPAMMLRFAQCMRAHGITDWPDPNADGSFTLPATLAGGKTSPRWRQVRDVWTGSCKQYDPSGNLDTTNQ